MSWSFSVPETLDIVRLKGFEERQGKGQSLQASVAAAKQWVSAAIAAAAHALGQSWTASLAIGSALALSSTAIVMQLLEERGALSTPKGQRIVAILLLAILAA